MPVLPSDTASTETRRYSRTDDARKLAAALGIIFVERWESQQTESFSYHGWRPVTRGVPLRGADYHLRIDGTTPTVLEVGGETWRLETMRGALAVVTKRDTLRLPLDGLIEFAHRYVAGPDAADAPHVTQESPSARVTLAPVSYSGFAKGDSVTLYQLTGDLYVTLHR